MKKVISLLCVTMFCIYLVNPIYSHSGRTDKNGGHTDSRTGIYHYHRAAPKPLPKPKLEPKKVGEVGSEINDAQQAILDARRDASMASNTPYVLSGFLCGIIGIGIAYLDPAQVPVEKLVGKSPEYISFYTVEYKQRRRYEQVLASASGCMVAVGFAFVVSQMYQTR